MSEIVERLKAKPVEFIHGCSDRFCYLTGPRSGQATNGGCRCVSEHPARATLMAMHKERAEAASHIEELEEQLAKGREINHEWATHNEFLKERNKKLEEALEPFVNAGSMEIKGNGMVNVLLSIEDIERARRALRGRDEA